MKKLIRFSAIPYRKKQEQLKLLEENMRAFKQEMRERDKWKIKNSFNEEPYLDKWDKYKRKNKKELENMMISAISITDAAETASAELAMGLGMKDALIDMDAVEDLVTNIYLVKLTEFISSKNGANLSKEVQDLVTRAVIAQIFPAALPMKPPPTPDKGNELIERALAIRNNRV